MPSPVSKGQTIKLEPESKWLEITVEWQQSFRSNSAPYFKADFENLSPDTETGLSVFIQKEKLNDFKKLAQQEGDSLKVTINDEFQYGYGGNKSDRQRWLVYHDKNRNPYQHRFIQGVLVKLGNNATEFAKRFGFGDSLQSATGFVKGMVGDALRNF